MKNLINKNEKGITLIALVITIIVLIILAGIAISMLRGENGVLNKTNSAKESTQLAADKDELKVEIGAVYADKQGSLDLNKLSEQLTEKKWNITLKDNKLICTSPSENIFTVNEKGEVIEGGNKPGENSDIAELEQYFFDEEGKGKAGLLEMDKNTNAITFINDTNTIADASTSILYMNNGSDNGENYIVIEYKGADYKVNVTSFNFATATAKEGSDNEKITELPTIYEGTDEEIKIKQYFLGYSGQGKYLINLLDMELSDPNGAYIFKNNSIISDATSLIVLLGFEEGSFTIKYNNTSTYTIVFDSSSMISKDVIKEVVYDQPIAYGDFNNSVILETSSSEALFWIKEMEISFKYKIVPCTNMLSLKNSISYDEVTNESGIQYSKALVDENGDFRLLVYSRDLQSWISVGSFDDGVNDKQYYILDKSATTDKTTLTQEQINTIIQAAK